MNKNIEAKDRLIVALDFNTADEAMQVVKKLGDEVEFYKVGWQLFFGTHYTVINELAGMGKKVFLDLKMSDIPTTIQQAIKNTPSKSVDFVELMTLDGVSEVVIAAKEGASSDKLKFLMLTVLSSMDDDDIKSLYGKDATIDKVISYRAKTAIELDCDGVIASGESVRNLRNELGDDFYIVTPGIRTEGASTDDHKRSLTPYQAITYGSDYLVVGRPIVQASDPLEVAKNIITDIQKALDEKKPKTVHKNESNYNGLSDCVGAAQMM